VKVEVLIGIWAAAQVADGVMTYVLASGGVVREGNPFVVPVAASLAFVTLKVLGAVVFAVVLWLVSRKVNVVPALVILAAMGVGILAWNLSVLF